MLEERQTLSLGGMTKSFTFLPGDDTLPAIVCIHGYCQSGQETWAALVKRLRQHATNTIIVVERLPTRRYPYGRAPVQDQIDEMMEIAEALVEQCYIMPMQQIVWIGHSLGATLTRRLTNIYPRKTFGLVQIAPAPACGWWILGYIWFWLFGGVVGLLPAFSSWISGQPVRYPRSMIRGLFAGWHCSKETIDRYCSTLQPDSGRLFPEFLLTHGVGFNGDELTEARQHGFVGRSIVVGCKLDAIVPNLATHWLAWRSGSQLRWIDEAHCWWVQTRREQTIYEIITAVRWVLGRN